MDHRRFRELIDDLYRAVTELEKLTGRRFTLDGHMVGSIGECLVADAYDLTLERASNQGFDATTHDGIQVEIKATQGQRVAFRSCPQHAIVVRINQNGTFDEIYNGPGSLVWSRFAGKPRPSNGQYQIGLATLAKLAEDVAAHDRVPRRGS